MDKWTRPWAHEKPLEALCLGLLSINGHNHSTSIRGLCMDEIAYVCSEQFLATVSTLKASLLLKMRYLFCHSFQTLAFTKKDNFFLSGKSMCFCFFSPHPPKYEGDCVCRQRSSRACAYPQDSPLLWGAVGEEVGGPSLWCPFSPTSWWHRAADRTVRRETCALGFFLFGRPRAHLPVGMSSFCPWFWFSCSTEGVWHLKSLNLYSHLSFSKHLLSYFWIYHHSCCMPHSK